MKSKVWARLKSFTGRHQHLLLGIAGLLLLLYVFLPQLSDLKQSLKAVESADPGLLLLAVLIYCFSFPVVAQKFCKIAQFSLKFLLTLKEQVAAAFVSKLLPMSIGSLTVNSFYLTKVSQSPAAAASVMTFNALTSSLAFALIVVLALIASWGSFSGDGVDTQISWLAVLGIIVLAGIGIWLLTRIDKIRLLIKKGLGGLWQDFQAYRQEPSKASWGILLNGLGSLASIATFCICCNAVGLDVSLAQAVICYTLGNIIGSLVPTPGGLGGVESGLYSGLILFNFESSASFVAVCLYRLITYWLPIIPGYLMYRNLRHSIFAGFKIKSG